MKKILSLALSLILLLSVTACSNTDKVEEGSSTSKVEQTKPAKDKDTDKAPAKEPVKLVVWGGVPAESGPQDVVDMWNAENPMVQVEYVRFVNDDSGNTKLDTAILSGEQIDLFFTYSIDLLKKRVDGGLVEDLANFNVNEFIKKDVVGAGVGQVEINDSIYALPTCREPFGMMINQDMLKAKNIAIPKDWTVDEYMDIASQLTGEYDGKKVYGAHVYSGQKPIDFVMPVLGGDYMYTADGTASNFDAKEFQVLTKLKEMMKNGSAMPYDEVFSRKLASSGHTAFLNGELAMIPFSAWQLRYVKDLENYPHDFKVTFAPFPTLEKGVDNNFQAYLNNHICMNSSSKYKEEAWAFMQYWLKEGSKGMLKAGKTPVWNAADDQVVMDGILGENAATLFDSEAYKNVVLNPKLKYIINNHTVAFPQIVQIYKEESETYFLDAVSTEDYYKNLKKRSDSVIKKEMN